MSRELRRLYANYGPWAVVTGASDGIGRALARRLAEAGLSLVLVARREDRLTELADELRARHSIETLVLPIDLAVPGASAQVFARTAALHIGLLVAAAGFGTSGPFTDAPLDAELGMIDVNCRAVAEACHYFGRRFADQRRGGIVLMSSLLAFQGVPRAANYAATKAYIQTLAEGLGRELAEHGVDVVASAPGPIHSGFAARAHMVMSMAAPVEVVASATLHALGRKRVVRPGWLSKLLEASLAVLPRGGRVWIMNRVMRGMTKHQPAISARTT